MGAPVFTLMTTRKIAMRARHPCNTTCSIGSNISVVFPTITEIWAPMADQIFLASRVSLTIILTLIFSALIKACHLIFYHRCQ